MVYQEMAVKGDGGLFQTSFVPYDTFLSRSCVILFTMIILPLEQRLEILADSATYDVSCSSSGKA